MKLSGGPIVFGMCLVLAVLSGTLLLTWMFRVDEFPVILWACTENGLDAATCSSGALNVGLLSLVAYGGVLLAGLGLGIFRSGNAGSIIGPSQQSTVINPLVILFLCGVLALMIAHSTITDFGIAYASRLNEADALENLISLENLILPLLLQFWMSTPDGPLKRTLLAIVIMGMSLSPYRAMLLTVFGFGFLLPFFGRVSTWATLPSVGRDTRGLVRNAVLMTGFGAVLLVSGYIDTTTRSPSLMVDVSAVSPRIHLAANGQTDIPVAAPGADVKMPPRNTFLRLTQRIVFPLYQAAIAGRIIDTMAVPSFSDLVWRKLRLGNAPNLEEFLFRRIYGGEGRNEVTSLSYGEAMAYFPRPPILWIAALPLLLIGGWRLAMRMGIQSATLFGIAIWRSSLTGLLPILPAMAFQFLGLMTLDRVRLERVLPGSVSRVLAVFLTLLLGVAAAGETWKVATTMDRRTLLMVHFSVDPGCAFVNPTWVPQRFQEYAAADGWKLLPVLAAYDSHGGTVAVPFGWRIGGMVDKFAEVMARLTKCPGRSGPGDGAPIDVVHVGDMQRLLHPINPLDLVVLYLLASAFWQMRRNLSPGEVRREGD